MYDESNKLNIDVLDSIFSADANYPHTFVLIDSVENTTQLSNQKSLDSYTYKSKPFYIGIQARQTIFLYYDIPLNSFLRESILIVISSILILSIAIALILAQVKITRRNKALAQQMRENINGVIHDLKTPLAGVAMTLSFAIEKVENKQIRGVFSLNQSKIKHLISNIDSLLSVVRKRNTLQREMITTQELLDTIFIIVSDLNNIYTYRPHTIEVKSHLSEDATFSADKLHLENILRNLLDNSVKYADSGVEVVLTIEEAGNAIKFTVSDNGWGIPKREQKKVFRRFYRVEQSSAVERGYGVGLSQVKQLVKKHGGQIHLQSAEGMGSTFIFIIPKTN